MTKIQMKNAALSLAAEHKANKKLTAALTELFDTYTKTGKLDSVKREKLITKDGRDYQWCNRHEQYEPLENFKNDKAPECKLATTYWKYLGKQVTEAQEALDKLIDDEKYDEIKPAKLYLEAARATRGGRYDFEANALQFADIENYYYSTENFIQDGEV